MRIRALLMTKMIPSNEYATVKTILAVITVSTVAPVSSRKSGVSQKIINDSSVKVNIYIIYLINAPTYIRCNFLQYLPRYLIKMYLLIGEVTWWWEGNLDHTNGSRKGDMGLYGDLYLPLLIILRSRIAATPHNCPKILLYFIHVYTRQVVYPCICRHIYYYFKVKDVPNL